MCRSLHWSRRNILKRGLVGMAGMTGIPYMLTSGALGNESKPAASERLALGFIGAGGMGRNHLERFLKVDDVHVTAIADVYAKNRKKAMEQAGMGCKEYSDYRELLARPDIDAVVIATPDHWHALTAIHACEAGKDVYCEKPLSLTIKEARSMVTAARRHGTVFQVGSQQRSDVKFRRACEWVLSGRIGKLEFIKTRIGGGPTCDWEPNEKPPEGLDWNFWLGPAPWAEYTTKRCIYNFRWFYDYSGGKVTDWGAHHNDIAQWGNGTSHSGPVKIETISVTFPTRGLYETAVDFETKMTYANGVVLYMVSEGNDVEFHGTDGWIKVNRERVITSNPDIEQEPPGSGDVHLYESPNHHRDWLNCIRSRKRPICDVEIGCRSVTVCHLANIAMRTGRTVEWNPEKEEITNDANLNRWLSRPYRAPWRSY